MGQMRHLVHRLVEYLHHRIIYMSLPVCAVKKKFCDAHCCKVVGILGIRLLTFPSSLPAKFGFGFWIVS